jgi:hypothetical protein
VVGAGGALAGAANSQSLKGAAWGAVSALTFYGIGSYFEGASWATSGKHVFGTNLNYGGFASKVLAHGVAGGALQHLQGGRFGSGFAAAGITQAFSGAIDGIDPANPSFPWEPVLTAALLGGAVSDLTGGKFAHGAVTAAFARAFNENSHRRDRRIDTNFFDPIDRIHSSAELASEIGSLPEGDVTIAGHGASVRIEDQRDGRAVSLYGEELVEFLKTTYPNLGEGSILVFAHCHAALDPGGGLTSIAQQVADALKITVIAPDNYVHWYTDGTVVVAGRMPAPPGTPASYVVDPNAPGHWVTITPGTRQ